MKQKWLVPRKDVLVRDPLSKSPLPEVGLLVDWNSFWRRRVKQGDCAIGTAPEPEEKVIYTEEELEGTPAKEIRALADENNIDLSDFANNASAEKLIDAYLERQ